MSVSNLLTNNNFTLYCSNLLSQNGRISTYTGTLNNSNTVSTIPIFIYNIPAGITNATYNIKIEVVGIISSPAPRAGGGFWQTYNTRWSLLNSVLQAGVIISTTSSYQAPLTNVEAEVNLSHGASSITITLQDNVANDIISYSYEINIIKVET